MTVTLSKSTQIWGAGSQPGAATPAPDPHCPLCQAPLGPWPFCLRDGGLPAGAQVTISDRYSIEESLGSGGTGFVFGGRHRILGKPVAIKVLRPEVRLDAAEAQRFLRAARIASQLAHENIVSILDFGEDAALQLHYLVMERLWGPTLAELIAQGAPLPWPRAIDILTQLCRALAAAHLQSVTHRDLNPRNVLLIESSGRRDVVKLCDFGLSRTMGGADRVTRTGAILGTPAYMAPEQIRGEAVQDHRADLYALGVTAYEMLTGKLPQESTTPVALIASRLTEAAPPLRVRRPDIDVPAELEALVLACLARNPCERPANAAELEQALLALGTGGAASLPASGDLVGQRIGSYEVTALLGTGGVGSVYRARHPVIGTEVAIKVLLPEVAKVPGMVERFVQEARAASAIGSEHIPKCFDFGHLPDRRAYAVMELVEGETLAQHLHRRGPLPPAEVAELVGQIAQAMAQAHAAEIVHRDLKPENILLARGAGGVGGAVAIKVLDFGIAKMLAASTSPRLTQFGMFLGTPFYCAPEQAMGKEVGVPADIYALGAIAFELLCGRPPFLGEIPEILVTKATTPAPDVRTVRADVPKAVAATIGSMLALDPNARLGSMTQVRAAVQGWLRLEAASSPSRARAVPPSSRALFADGLFRLVAAGVVLLVAAGLYFALRHTRPKPQPEPVHLPAAIAPTPPARPAEPSPAPPAPVLEKTERPGKKSTQKGRGKPTPIIIDPFGGAHP